MNSRKPRTLLVYLVFLVSVFALDAQAWNFKVAAAPDRQEDLFSPSTAQNKPIEKVKTKQIVKCKPAFSVPTLGQAYVPSCFLPQEKQRSWKFEAEALFARVKGHVKYSTGSASYFLWQDEIDLNSDLGLPDHAVLGTFSATYKFRPQWGVRYSIMPFALDGSGTIGRNFTFGNSSFTTGQPSRVKWERLYQRIGLVYDPVQTAKARIGIFADYVRIDDKLSAYQGGCCSDVMNNDLNMGMAGIEYERCLKTTANCNTLSFECRAGVAFLDEAFGSDISSALKYSIPMNNGRWGFVKGGYRYMTFKKKYSDVRSFDTAMDGGFVQMGFLF